MSYKLQKIICNVDNPVLNPLLEPNAKATIHVTGITTNDERVEITPEQIKWTARPIFTYGDDEVVAVNEHGIVTPLNGGYACVEARWTGKGHTLTDSVKIIVRPFYIEYHKTITAKLPLAMEPYGSLKNPPSEERDDSVHLTFEEALDVIRRMDKITYGFPKIFYLVGWQRGGHDHGYPAFNEVNPRLKRKQDPDARESMRWLIREARKYNTTVSVHINVFDGWSDSPLFDLYRENHILTEREDGSHVIINGFEQDAAAGKVYPVSICQKRLWESGFFKDRIKELLDLVPEILDSHTIHFDNWQACGSPGLGITPEEDEEAIKSMILWLREIGLDVTSEGSFHGRSQPMTGLQPMAWWDPPYTPADMPVSLYCGGRAGRTDGDPRFGDNIHVENTVYTNLRKGRDPMFGLQDEFCMYTLPWQFINNFTLESFDGETAVYSDGVKTFIENGNPVIYWHDTLIRKGTTMFVPMLWAEGRQIMLAGFRESWVHTKLPVGWEDVEAIEICYVDPMGINDPVVEEIRPIQNGRIDFCPQSHCAYIIRPYKA